MIDDLFVPDPPAGDNSNRIADTRFVQNAVGSATVSGLSVLGNASTVVASAAAITGAADQMLAVNHAATTVLFTSISSFIDSAIASTQGAILYRNAATWVALAPGTQSSFLQTQGAAANPQWASAGQFVLLNTLTPASQTNVLDNTSLTNSYFAYLFVFDNIIPTTNNTQFRMRVSTDLGTTILTATYDGYVAIITSGGAAGASSSSAQINLTRAELANSANVGFSGDMMCYNPSAGNSRTHFRGKGVYYTSGNNIICDFMGMQDTGNTAINAVQFSMTSGQIATGVIKVYGLT